MALVLPATVLSRRSCEGIRRLWAEKYHIEYIITTSQRLAFSESTLFREILVVARKVEADTNLKTYAVMLKQFPQSIREVREISETIKQIRNDWEDKRIVVKIHSYSKLKSETKNWFKYIAISDLGLVDLILKILQSQKLVPILSIVKALESDLRHYKFEKFHGFICGEYGVEKTTDMWVIDKIQRNKLIAKHRKLGHKVEIPLEVLGRGLRRFSQVANIDVTKNSDYLILEWFDGIRDLAKTFLTSKELERFKESIVNNWRKKFETRKTHLLLARRPYLSSPGTSLIAFYSDVPIVGIDMWSIRNIDKECAKILALWLNSSFNLLQLLTMGVASEGPWMKIHDYMLDDLLAPDPAKLSNQELRILLMTFDKIKEVRLPSILDQLKNSHTARKLIDVAWLKVLGYKDEIDKLLDKLYSSLAKEIELQKLIMTEQNGNE